MKKTILILAAVVLGLSSCKKEDIQPNEPTPIVNPISNDYLVDVAFSGSGVSVKINSQPVGGVGTYTLNDGDFLEVSASTGSFSERLVIKIDNVKVYDWTTNSHYYSNQF